MTDTLSSRLRALGAAATNESRLIRELEKLGDAHCHAHDIANWMEQRYLRLLAALRKYEALRSNLPAIVLALDENERMREAVTAIRNLCANWSDSPDFNPTVTEVHELARAALAQIKDTRP